MHRRNWCTNQIDFEFIVCIRLVFPQGCLGQRGRFCVFGHVSHANLQAVTSVVKVTFLAFRRVSDDFPANCRRRTEFPRFARFSPWLLGEFAVRMQPFDDLN